MHGKWVFVILEEYFAIKRNHKIIIWRNVKLILKGKRIDWKHKAQSANQDWWIYWHN